MALRLKDYEDGVKEYWKIIDSRSWRVREIERAFPNFATTFATRQPRHFNREDLEQIIEWKHSADGRRCSAALSGLREFPDDRIIGLTANIGEDIPRSMKSLFCQRRFAGEVSGIGVATVSAILTAARPDLFAVIDTFALTAIYHHYNFPWLYKLSRDEKHKLMADWNAYPPYVGFCRAEAAKITMTSKDHPWTPRQIDIALWGIGKKLTDNGLA